MYIVYQLTLRPPVGILNNFLRLLPYLHPITSNCSFWRHQISSERQTSPAVSHESWDTL